MILGSGRFTSLVELCADPFSRWITNAFPLGLTSLSNLYTILPGDPGPTGV